MKPLGLAVAFVGYWVAYFGWASLKGPGVGFVDLVVPGREIVIYDGSGASSSGSGSSTGGGIIAEKGRKPGSIGPPLGNGAPPPILGKDPVSGKPVPYA